MNYRIVQHDQGSAKWLRWRHDGIGASDAPALMGENPWKRPQRLFSEKTAPPPAGNWGGGGGNMAGGAAARGTALEPYARDHYNRLVDAEAVALCVESIDRPWQRASLDGICTATRRLVEIKCGDKVYAHSAETGTVPGYYTGQLQHQMAVTGHDQIDFFVWLPGRNAVLICVPRDDAYIAAMTARQAEFWNRVLAARGELPLP